MRAKTKGPLSLFLPRPAAFDVNDERPAKEGAHKDEKPQYTNALKCRTQDNRMYDVSGDEDLKYEQQSASNVVPV